MTHKDDFADFLSSQKQKVDDGIKLEQEFKTNFPKSINDLYDEIERWLKPYSQQGQISIREDHNSTSIAFHNLIITIGSKEIHFVPEQQVFLGSRGIIRVKYQGGIVKNLRQPEWNKWLISAPNEKRTGHVENVINAKPPIYLNEQTIKDLLKEIAG